MQRKYFYRDEIKKILIQYGISFIVICSLLIYGFLGYYSKQIVENKNEDYNQFTRDVLSNELRAYEDIIDTLENHESVQNYVLTGEHQSEVYELLYHFNNEVNMKSVFYIVDKQGETILSSNYVESPYSGYEMFLSGLFKQLKNNSDEIVYMNNKVQIDLNKRTVYSIGKALKINGAIEAYLIFDILESDFKKTIYSPDSEILIITDQYNNAIISSNSIFLDEIGKFNVKPNLNTSRSTMDLMGESYYYTKSELSDGKIRIYTLSELNWIKQLLNMTITFALFIMLGLSGMIFYTADYISKKKTQSITQFIDSINRVKDGDLKAFVSINTGDEFQLIGEQFNEMLRRLDLLIGKNNELLDRNRIAEMKQLESQFNPHFIFNTLETLKYMITVDQEKAMEMIVKFANLLRYSIDYEMKTIALEKDIMYLNNYLALQKFRYNQRLTYDINIVESAKTFVVPKLILQPIVENCINHGYKSKESLHIQLNIVVEDGELVMTVIDNGDGVPDSKLAEINMALDDDQLETNSIGLTNVHRRLKLLYGKGYGITIKSTVTVGTTVLIRVPRKEW